MGNRGKWMMAAALVALAGCRFESAEQQDPNGNAATYDDRRSPDAQLFAAFLRDHGVNVGACFEAIPIVKDAAQAAADETVSEMVATPPANRVVVAIDSSASAKGEPITAAKEAVRGFLTGLPDKVEVGLIAFGHRGAGDASGKGESCKAVESVYPIGKADATRIENAMGLFDASGWTPLARAIERAGDSFAPSDVPGANLVYVVSDGEESCGGDPVSAARALHEGDTRAVVHVIGYNLKPAARAQLKAVAAAGGGSFIEAKDSAALKVEVGAARTRLDGTIALGQAQLRRYGPAASGDLETQGAVARLNQCVRGGIGRETLAAGDWLTDRVVDPGLRRRVEARIEARHARFDTQRKRYIAQATGVREGPGEADTANGTAAAIRNEIE